MNINKNFENEGKAIAIAKFWMGYKMVYFILTVKTNVYQKLDKIGIFIDMKFH